MNIIDYQDARPIYEQIVENFKMQILRGILQPGDQMPSVRSLAMELSANPNTIQKAYSILEMQGFIYTVKGRGNFVNGDASLKDVKKQELAKRLLDLFTEAESLGISRVELMKSLPSQEEKA